MRPEIATGDDAGDFASFYREHIDRVVAYLIYQGAPAHLAAELAQEAMIAAYQRWHEIAWPKAYVWKTAYRAYIRAALADAEEPVAEIPNRTALLPDPEESEAWLQKQQVIELLRAMPPRQRQVLALTIDGWAPIEIAGLLGIGSTTVRSSLKKARLTAGDYVRRFREEP